MLNFEGSVTWPLQQQGMQDAQDAISGSGVVNVAPFIKEWIADESLRAKHPVVADYIDARQKMD